MNKKILYLKAEIEESNLSESSFIESNIKNLYLDKVDLNKVEFIKTNLSGIDFSNSDITTTIFDLNSLKGIVIDRFQSSSLVGMLGVKLKD